MKTSPTIELKQKKNLDCWEELGIIPNGRG